MLLRRSLVHDTSGLLVTSGLVVRNLLGLLEKVNPIISNKVDSDLTVESAVQTKLVAILL